MTHPSKGCRRYNTHEPKLFPKITSEQERDLDELESWQWSIGHQLQMRSPTTHISVQPTTNSQDLPISVNTDPEYRKSQRQCSHERMLSRDQSHALRTQNKTKRPLQLYLGGKGSITRVLKPGVKIPKYQFLQGSSPVNLHPGKKNQGETLIALAQLDTQQSSESLTLKEIYLFQLSQRSQGLSCSLQSD